MMNMHDSLNCVGLRVGDVHIITKFERTIVNNRAFNTINLIFVFFN